MWSESSPEQNPARGVVVVIDDEKNITFVIGAMLRRVGYEVSLYNDSTEALSRADFDDCDAVITDLYMPGPGGMEVLEYCQQHHPALPVVFITAYGTVESAVAALKRGAFDFITKPFDQAELLNSVQKAVQTHRQRQKEPLSIQLPSPPSPGSPEFAPPVISSGPKIQEVLRIVNKVAPSSSTVLLQGESGTGKEIVAFEIHRRSPRALKPFIRINCSAIPAALIESELLGHEAGAFSGAVSAKPGKFELAHEGTLFLDEVGELPLEMQVKLLRVLQDQELERLGAVNTTRVEVRVIAATNRDLEAEVRAGRFREDLYYGLNVVPIVLPPLRERREDIEPLIRYFIPRFNDKLGKAISGISSDTLQALRQYVWPGNVRQLENVIERMMLMAEGEQLQLRDLPEEISDSLVSAGNPDGGEPGLPSPAAASFKERVKRQTQNVERDLIERALEETTGNVTRAAEKLGLSRKGLQLKIKELGVRR